MMHSLLRPLAAAAILVAFATLPAGAQTLLDKAREAVRDAGETIEDAARDAGRDASDFLADNPDLNRDILDLGQRMGLPGFEDAKTYAGANLTAAPAEAGPGAGVMLTAAGLPGKAKVKLGFGPRGGDYHGARHGDSRLRTAARSSRPVTVPDRAKPGDKAVFTVETADGRVRLDLRAGDDRRPRTAAGDQDQRQWHAVERGRGMPRAPRRRRQALHARRPPGGRLQARRSRPCRRARWPACRAACRGSRSPRRRSRRPTGRDRPVPAPRPGTGRGRRGAPEIERRATP